MTATVGHLCRERLVATTTLLVKSQIRAECGTVVSISSITFLLDEPGTSADPAVKAALAHSA
jgi:hypothetical protein